MATQQDVIKKFMASLDNTTLSGTAALDEAIKACSNFNGIQEVIDKMVSDCRTVNDADDFLIYYCGIKLYNDDTGAITGWDAGGSIIKNKEDIVPETGELINFTGNSFTVNGLTLQLEKNFSDLTDAQKFMWQGLYTWWAKGALDLIAESYGNNFGFDSNSSATAETLYVYFGQRENSLAWVQGGKHWFAYNLGISNSYYSNIDTTNPNGTGSTYLDRVLAHEFTHAVMIANIDYFGSLPEFIKEGMAELTHGIDDERKSLISSLAGSASSLESSLNLNTSGGEGNVNAYAGGYMFLRYLAKQAADEDHDILNSLSAVVLTGTASNDDFVNTGDSVTIDCGLGNDVIMNTGKYSSINGGSGNDHLRNINYGVTISGGAGNDYIRDEGSGSKILGGSGNDSIVADYKVPVKEKYAFVYGLRTTIDGGMGNDNISVYGGEWNSISGDSGNDVIHLQVTNSTIDGGSDNDTIDVDGYDNIIIGGRGDDVISLSSESGENVLQYAQGDGNDTVYINGETSSPTLLITGATYTTIAGGYDLTVNIGSGSIFFQNGVTGGRTPYVKILNFATNDKSNTLISGTEQADSIENEGDSVTIDGGAADDYIYSTGNNVSISAGAGDDSITISGSNTTVNGGKGTDYILLTEGNNRVIQYSSGDGYDGVYGFTSSDTLKISGSTYSTMKSGKDIAVIVGNGGVVLKNTAGTSIHIETDNDIETVDSRSIFNSQSSTIVNGTANADSIENMGTNVTINAGAGDDSIFNYSSNYTSNSSSVKIYAEAGNDSIKNWGSYVTIDGGAGNDTIENRGSYILIDGGAGADYVSNSSGSNLTINAGAGDDSVRNRGDNIKINTGEGNDYVYSSGSNVTINCEGNDTITGGGTNVVINGNVGNESITTSASNGTINSGNGEDSIYVTGGENLKIDSGADNDYIKAGGYNGVISAGIGNDSVELSNNPRYSTINGGAGDDSIYGGNITNTANVAINGGDGNDRISVAGSYSTINGDAGNDYIQNYGTSSKVYGGAGNDTIENHSYRGTIDGGAGKDSIVNGGSEVKIDGGADDDYIYNTSRIVTIEGGAGNDSIKNENGFSVVINGGDGNDSISNNMSNVTITGGKGNDYISIDNEYVKDTVVYSSGDGNDTIVGFNSQSTLQITGSKYSTTKSGSDLKISVGNGSILLKGAANLSVNIVGTLGGGTVTNETLPAGISVKNSVVTASNKFTGNEINLADYNATKVNAAALSRGISIVGTAANNSIKGGRGADTLSGGAGNDTLIGGGGADIFVYSGGNDLITDYKPCEDKIKIGAITSSTVKGSDVILTTNAGKLTVKGAKDKAVTFINDSGETSDKIFFADTSYAPLDTGLTYDAKRTVLTASSKFTGTEINLGDYLSSVTKINASAVKQGLNLVGNSAANSIKGGKGADTISGGAGNDTLIGGNGADLFIYSGGNDIITDYKAGEDKIKIGAITSSTVKGSDVILTTNTGKLTVKGAKDKAVTFIDDRGNSSDKIFFADTSYAPLATGLTYDAKRILLTASNKFTGSEINLGEYLSSVTKINASAVKQGLNLVGNSAANSIKGGKGADTLSGGAGNDTLIGGNGADLFIYSGGNDIITDYKAGEDKIKIGAITSSTVKGSDVILTTESGKLTVKGAKDKAVTFIDDRGNSSDKIFFADTSYAPLDTGLTYDAKRTVLTASNKFTGTEINLGDYLSSVTKINASAVKQGLNLVGNSAANSIKGGKGADTISGGAGNDTLIGGGGADIFIYSGGNDIITDYTAGQDKIKISGTITNTAYKNKDVIYTIGGGTLTIKNGKGKEITFDNTSARTAEIFVDDNFISDSPQLSNITEQKFEVTQIQPQSQNFAQVEKILTFAKK